MVRDLLWNSVVSWWCNILCKDNSNWIKVSLLATDSKEQRDLVEKHKVIHLVNTFPAFYYRLKVYYYACKSLSLVPIQVTWIQSTQLYLRSVFIISHVIYARSSRWSLQVLWPKLCMYFSYFPMHATCPVHFILLSFIFLTIHGEECKLWSTTLYSFLYPPVTTSFIVPNTILSILFSYTCSPLMWKTYLQNNRQNYSLYILIFMFLVWKWEDKRFRTEW
jgi:hypothetical protein